MKNKFTLECGVRLSFALLIRTEETMEKRLHFYHEFEANLKENEINNRKQLVQLYTNDEFGYKVGRFSFEPTKKELDLGFMVIPLKNQRKILKNHNITEEVNVMYKLSNGKKEKFGEKSWWVCTEAGKYKALFAMEETRERERREREQ